VLKCASSLHLNPFGKTEDKRVVHSFTFSLSFSYNRFFFSITIYINTVSPLDLVHLISSWLAWEEIECTVHTSVSNRMGQCKFLGERDRSSFIVAGQRNNRTSSKSCNRTGRAGSVYQNPGRVTGRDNHYCFVKIRDGMRDRMGQSLFFLTISCFRTSNPISEHTFFI
jgi:hypothetical protein